MHEMSGDTHGKREIRVHVGKIKELSNQLSIGATIKWRGLHGALYDHAFGHRNVCGPVVKHVGKLKYTEGMVSSMELNAKVTGNVAQINHGKFVS
jgi:hypothetical protein